jgi:hypothetical protein
MLAPAGVMTDSVRTNDLPRNLGGLDASGKRKAVAADEGRPEGAAKGVEESDGFVVPRRQGNACGGKGPTR